MALKARKSGSKKEPAKKPLPLVGWGIVLGVALLVAGLAWWMKTPNENKWTHIKRFGIRLPMKYPVHGIDISHHNARIDWEKLKAVKSEGVRIDFVYIKATEGASHYDRQFERNWREARRVGMKRGAYHFYNPRVYSNLQAENFIKRVKMQKGDLPPVLDLEVEAGKPADIIIKGVRNWLTLIEKHYGVRPIIYTNEHFYLKYIAGNFNDYPLWLAGYSRTHLGDLADNSQVLFWQHSEKGWVDGVKGYVDFNVYLYDAETWEKFEK
ncbi:glycoside hydrolase family 25 protein [Telluribacter sp.]|uniref:glycoside hydrolase family 25 protein n=1 Tax=Telluribacter sp. TaxID=1978767 RepID=UPI002E0F0F56|nr:GH25 family lysozyme [Telluribacter sp.]